MTAVESNSSWQPSYSAWRYDCNPYHEYDEDDSDSDSDSDLDDDDNARWSTGITDYAQFTADRRAAADRHEGIPPRWDGLLERQRDAMKRAEARSQSSSTIDKLPSSPSTEAGNDVNGSAGEDELPFLTPDGSPRIPSGFDNLSLNFISTHEPSHHTVEVQVDHVPDLLDSDAEDIDASTYSEDFEDEEDEDDDEIPVAVLIERARRRRLSLSRPGLTSTRTLSGKVHVWRRPSGQIYTVGEEDETL